MAINAMPWRSSLLSPCRLVGMATAAEIVKLPLEQWPHLLLSRMAVHARTTTRLVVVIVMAEDAVFGLVILMGE
jgi:hypothetical protein